MIHTKAIFKLIFEIHFKQMIEQHSVALIYLFILDLSVYIPSKSLILRHLKKNQKYNFLYPVVTN